MKKPARKKDPAAPKGYAIVRRGLARKGDKQHHFSDPSGVWERVCEFFYGKPIGGFWFRGCGWTVARPIKRRKPDAR